MGIALVVVGGLVAMTLFASVFSYLGERKKRIATGLQEKLETIETRLSALEERTAQEDERFEQIESDVSFVNKLISGRKG